MSTYSKLDQEKEYKKYSFEEIQKQINQSQGHDML